MTHIPSLTHQQLVLLKLTKKHSVEEIRLAYEFAVIDQAEPPIGHPSFIQGLIDAHLIQVQVKGTCLSASEFQQESWTEFCEGINHPPQEAWNLWRERYITQGGGIDPLMTPGNNLDEFSTVWIRLISIQAIQPGRN